MNPFSQYINLANLELNQNLISKINENEIGPIIFDSIKIQNNIDSRYFLFYDDDFGRNSSFELLITDCSPSNDLIKYPTSKISASLTFNPNYSIYNNNTLEFEINGKSSLNIINYRPFDFDELNINPSIDPFTGIGVKSIKFNVSLIKS